MNALIKRRSRKGLAPICLRIRSVDTSTGKIVEKMVTLTKLPQCLPEHWIPRENKYSNKFPGHRIYNKALEKHKERLETLKKNLVLQGKKVTPEQFAELFLHAEEDAGISVAHNLELCYREKVKEGKIKTSRNYIQTLDRWRQFISQERKGTPVHLQQLKVRDLEEFSKYLLSTRKGFGGVNTWMRTMRAAYNRAIKYELIEGQTVSPFKKFEWSITRNTQRTKSKRPLTQEEWEILKAHQPKNHVFQYYKDLFLFMVYCYGINLKDLMHIKRDDIIERKDRNGNLRREIHFTRRKTASKTTKQVHVTLTPEMEEIIDRYRQESPYLLPILSEDKRQVKPGTIEWEKMYTNTVANINRRLKTLGEDAGIDNTLSTYVARHSFATLLHRGGAKISAISAALGHATIAQTESYLQRLDPDTVHDEISGIL